MIKQTNTKQTIRQKLKKKQVNWKVNTSYKIKPKIEKIMNQLENFIRKIAYFIQDLGGVKLQDLYIQLFDKVIEPLFHFSTRLYDELELMLHQYGVIYGYKIVIVIEQLVKTQFFIISSEISYIRRMFFCIIMTLDQILPFIAIVLVSLLALYQHYSIFYVIQVFIKQTITTFLVFFPFATYFVYFFTDREIDLEFYVLKDFSMGEQEIFKNGVIGTTIKENGRKVERPFKVKTLYYIDNENDLKLIENEILKGNKDIQEMILINNKQVLKKKKIYFKYFFIFRQKIKKYLKIQLKKVNEYLNTFNQFKKLKIFFHDLIHKLLF